MNAEERLKAAGWTRLHQPCDLTMYRWTRDGIDWFTEDEALVVVLTAERDAAIARAERAEAQRDSARRDANGAAHRGDMACARADAAEAQRDALQRHFDAAGPEHNLTSLFDLYEERAEAAEALAASRLDVSPELACGWLSERLGGPATSAVFAALRAHAAKVIR